MPLTRRIELFTYLLHVPSRGVQREVETRAPCRQSALPRQGIRRYWPGNRSGRAGDGGRRMTRHRQVGSRGEHGHDGTVAAGGGRANQRHFVGSSAGGPRQPQPLRSLKPTRPTAGESTREAGVSGRRSTRRGRPLRTRVRRSATRAVERRGSRETCRPVIEPHQRDVPEIQERLRPRGRDDVATVMAGRGLNRERPRDMRPQRPEHFDFGGFGKRCAWAAEPSARCRRFRGFWRADRPEIPRGCRRTGRTASNWRRRR